MTHACLVGLSLLSSRDADGSHHAGPVMLQLQKQDSQDPLLHPRCVVAEIKLTSTLARSLMTHMFFRSEKLLDDRCHGDDE